MKEHATLGDALAHLPPRDDPWWTPIRREALAYLESPKRTYLDDIAVSDEDRNDAERYGVEYVVRRMMERHTDRTVEAMRRLELVDVFIGDDGQEVIVPGIRMYAPETDESER